MDSRGVLGVKPSNELSRLLHVIVREEQHYLSKTLAHNGETVQLRFQESCYKTEANLL